MLVKIKINKETLEVETDGDFTVNHILQQDNILELELSKPDQENEYPWL